MKIFISYRRDDSAGYAGRLYDYLKADFGKENIFMDIDNIQPGADFRKAIENAVGACDIVLVMIGKQWLKAVDMQGNRRLEDRRDWVRSEAATALANPNVIVIPVLVGGAAMPKDSELPDELHELAYRNAVELSDKRFEYDAKQLIEGIKGEGLKPKIIEAEGKSTAGFVKLGAAFLGIAVLGLILWLGSSGILTGKNSKSPLASAPAATAIAVTSTAAAQVVHPQITEIHVNVQPYDIAKGYTGSPILLTPSLANESDAEAIAKKTIAEIMNIVQPSANTDYISTLNIDGNLLQSDKPLKADLIVVSSSNSVMQQPLARVEILDLSKGENLPDRFSDAAFFGEDCNCIHLVEVTAPSGGYKRDNVDIYKLPGGFSFDPTMLLTTKRIDLTVAPLTLLIEPSQGQGEIEADIKATRSKLDNALRESVQGNQEITLSPYKSLDELRKTVDPQITNIPIGTGKENYLSQNRVDFIVTITFVLK